MMVDVAIIGLRDGLDVRDHPFNNRFQPVGGDAGFWRLNALPKITTEEMKAISSVDDAKGFEL